jgi:hypothetical protein
MEQKINGMIDTMRAKREATLRTFFEQETTLSGRVGVVMATLECARQRFIEAKQYEQFGDVLLRYREDQDRAPVLDALPEEDVSEDSTKKRRRRVPLVTWRPPERGEEPEQQEIDLPELEEEAVVESDEQRFLRELEATCAVSAVLNRTADLEVSFVAFQAEQLAAAEAAAAAREAGVSPDGGTAQVEVVAESDELAVEAITLIKEGVKKRRKGTGKTAAKANKRAHEPSAQADSAGELAPAAGLIISNDGDDDSVFDSDADDYVEEGDQETPEEGSDLPQNPEN